MRVSNINNIDNKLSVNTITRKTFNPNQKVHSQNSSIAHPARSPNLTSRGNNEGLRAVIWAVEPRYFAEQVSFP